MCRFCWCRKNARWRWAIIWPIPDCEDFLLVDFGEGVGGAIIVEGKPLANPLPISGEIGHTPVPGNRRPCGCGAVGCMETLDLAARTA